MKESNHALLLVCYRRESAVKRIVETALSSGISRIYAVIDIGKRANSEDIEIQETMASIFSDFRNDCDVLEIYRRKANVGCAVSVITGADWIFSKERYAAILEDDCIPDSSFFDFCNLTIPEIERDPNTLLACGSQFLPPELMTDSWYKSNYALTWGWFTSRNKWSYQRNWFYETNFRINREKYFSHYEYLYWSAGITRALRGIVDVWDTILVGNLFINNKFSILPSVSLVSNIGNDESATHTHDSPWLHKPLNTFKPSNQSPEINLVADSWLRKQFFGISPRHKYTTQIHKVIDDLTKQSYTPLFRKLVQNKVNSS